MSKTSGSIREGNAVRVVAGKHHVGEIGEVTRIYEDHILVRFSADPAEYAFEIPELNLTTNPAPEQGKEASKSTTASGITKLLPGQSVRVVAPGDEFDGRAGTIFRIVDDDEIFDDMNVFVAFAGEDDAISFRSDEITLECAPRAPRPRASSQDSSSLQKPTTPTKSTKPQNVVPKSASSSVKSKSSPHAGLPKHPGSPSAVERKQPTAELTLPSRKAAPPPRQAAQESPPKALSNPPPRQDRSSYFDGKPSMVERPSPASGNSWLQSIKDTGLGQVKRGSSRWVAGMAIIAVGAALFLSAFLEWGRTTVSGYAIAMSGLGQVSVYGSDNAPLTSFLEEQLQDQVSSSVHNPGIWTALVGLVSILGGLAYVWTARRSEASIVVAIACGLAFLACIGNVVNLASMMGDVSESGNYSIGFGLLLACALALTLVGSAVTAFVLERISMNNR
ncbi:hypothetical protein [Mycobacterium sp. 852002-51961_SCH5331710]|uniref:hypothetical protein n=1 Tax=Mycobacterium sp. 852002-51961_SCH5331710 TaxID=1834105 RepID=UPI0012E97108|nr:hypothetical protein [Mycobacterium sp. 852002-51961_SCH5331710]